jgi:hypothetical protein
MGELELRRCNCLRNTSSKDGGCQARWLDKNLDQGFMDSTGHEW